MGGAGFFCDSKGETENFEFLERQNYFMEKKNYIMLLPLLISICVQN